MLITLELAKNTAYGRVISRLNLLSPKHSLLSAFVLNERLNPESFWKPYLDVLPKDYSNFPIFFCAEELYYLKGSPFLKIIKDKIRDVEKDYESICSVKI